MWQRDLVVWAGAGAGAELGGCDQVRVGAGLSGELRRGWVEVGCGEGCVPEVGWAVEDKLGGHL